MEGTADHPIRSFHFSTSPPFCKEAEKNFFILCPGFLTF